MQELGLTGEGQYHERDHEAVLKVAVLDTAHRDAVVAGAVGFDWGGRSPYPFDIRSLVCSLALRELTDVEPFISQIVRLREFLVGRDLPGISMDRISQRLAAQDREPVVSLLAHTLPHLTGNLYDQIAVVNSVLGIPSEVRAGAVAAARILCPSGTGCEYFSDVVRTIGQAELATHSRAVCESIVEYQGARSYICQNLCALFECLYPKTVPEVRVILSDAATLSAVSASGYEYAHLVVTLSKCTAERRLTLVPTVLRFCSQQNLMANRHLIFEACEAVPVNRLQAVLSQARRLHALCQCNEYDLGFIISLFAPLAPEQLSPLVSQTIALSWPDMPQQHQNVPSVRYLLAALLFVAPLERADFLELCAPLRGRVELFGSITALAETPAAERAGHLARLEATWAQGGNTNLASVGGTEAGWRSNTESVMRSGFQTAVHESIARLSSRFPEAAAVNNVAAVQSHLQAVENALTIRPLTSGLSALESRARTQTRELDNAQRTLTGPRNYGDHSDSIAQNPEFTALISLVWHAIQSYERSDPNEGATARDRGLMLDALVMALARCIEDDGHRVCSVGQRQQFIEVLNGFYGEVKIPKVDPGDLLSELGLELRNQSEAPSAADIENFRSRALARGEEEFTDFPKLRATFEKDLQAFIATM